MFETIRFSRQKTDRQAGSTMLIAIFLSTIILSIGLGAAEMVIKELNFSSDLLFGEQAYYAAESGVEVALMKLEKLPVEHIEDVRLPLGAAAFSPRIDNIIRAGDELEAMRLEPLQTKRWRLLADTDAGLGAQLSPAFHFDVAVDPTGSDWQWKVLCQDIIGSTHSLQAVLSDQPVYLDFLYHPAVLGLAGNGIQTDFADWVAGRVPGIPELATDTCFFSLQNLSSNNLDFVITNQIDLMAPPVAKVESTGYAGNRQKRIDFDYAQQNLGGLFDFIFFHWEEEE